MKSVVNLLGLLFCSAVVCAQEPVQFFAHEDHVKPSMNAPYLEMLKRLKESYEKHQVDLSYSTFRQDDNTYYFFMPMERADIGAVYRSFENVESKIGKENFKTLVGKKGEYIDSHQEFVTELLPQFSYLQPGENDNFRHMMFWYPIEGMEDEVEQICQEWIALHKSKNSGQGYQTFRNVFGGEMGYVIVSWGRDHLDNLMKARKANELLGEDGMKLWARTMAITRKIDHKNGWFLPHLSYTHKPIASAK